MREKDSLSYINDILERDNALRDNIIEDLVQTIHSCIRHRNLNWSIVKSAKLLVDKHNFH